MKLVESILTKNPCYTSGRKITVKGLMLHSVGCNQPKASVFINSWNSASYDRDLAAGSVAGVLCQDRFNQFLLHISPFLEKRRCRRIPCE